MSPEEIAESALTLDPGEGAALVARLSTPPKERVWTSVELDGGLVFASVSGKDASIGHLDLLAVHPEQQGRGLGKELVRRAESWLREQGVSEARFAGNPPCYAWPGIDVRYTAAACLAERMGYERFHVAWNMTADLERADLETAADLARLERAGVRVGSGVTDAVVAFVEREWNERWAWEAASASGIHWAERDGEVVAFAAWGARPAWFGPMGTAPHAEGLGLGRVLLRLCLAEQRASGQRETQIGWVGPLRFYSRAVGARAERVFWLYRRELG